jgi:hypothetical protein
MEETIRRALRAFPAVVLTGPRRSGKTHLLRRLLPGAAYRLLEDPGEIARLRSDPDGFLDALQPPVILDEVQNVPDVFARVRARIDARPRARGAWILTGSREAALMRGVTESMAGRAAVLHLPPLASTESPRVDLLHGGYPEVVARPRDAGLWFSSYLQTYLERDVRSALAVRDPATFRRFLGLLAARHGQVLHRTDLAGPLGISIPTVQAWLDVLESTLQVLVVPPFHENFGKRLVRAPRVYVADPGLACHLLGIESRAELERSPFLGALFEGLVAGEILKAQANRGGRRELWFFRDRQGLEVDFVLPAPGGRVSLVECKAARSATPEAAGPMLRLAAAIGRRGGRTRVASMTVVHRGTGPSPLAPGVRALGWREFAAAL